MDKLVLVNASSGFQVVDNFIFVNDALKEFFIPVQTQQCRVIYNI
jgi:hypothetical protein